LQFKESGADVLISVGGGSPIDATKAIAFQVHKQTGLWVPSIAIPTTLSVAETTAAAGYTNEEGNKVGVGHPELAPKGTASFSIS
jgi:alcohol dehydrogenase class IV